MHTRLASFDSLGMRKFKNLSTIAYNWLLKTVKLANFTYKSKH